MNFRAGRDFEDASVHLSILLMGKLRPRDSVLLKGISVLLAELLLGLLQLSLAWELACCHPNLCRNENRRSQVIPCGTVKDGQPRAKIFGFDSSSSKTRVQGLE